ncbi:MAG TPA: hypothetical protein PLM66_06720, partial [Candidatus Latescibacteria bacterium]|nr:hypothetical protein [Candidatus Latescibacterota bacterium]
AIFSASARMRLTSFCGYVIDSSFIRNVADPHREGHTRMKKRYTDWVNHDLSDGGRNGGR